MKSALKVCFLFLFGFNLHGQSDLRKLNLNQRVKENSPITLSASDDIIILENYKYKAFGDDYLLKSKVEDQDVIDYSITKRGNEVSGFIYYPGQDEGYVIETKDGKVNYIKTPSSDILFVCSFTPEEEANVQEDPKEAVHPAFGNSATATELDLQSKPGATYLIYLDFDGESDIGGWEVSFGIEATEVPDFPVGLKQKIWESVAADFIPFDVNVTTNRALFDAHTVLYRQMAVFAEFGSPGWLGIAKRPSFGTGLPALIDLPSSWGGNLNYLYRTPSHELGHTLSLLHDGNDLNGDGEYYLGHGEYVPIMGTGNRLVTHWSKGQYSGATNTEDDIAIIHGYLGYSSDDFSGTRSVFFSGENINPIFNQGIIDNNTDEDVWKFEMTGTGNVKITVDPVLALTDLDVHLVLKNQLGVTIFEDNPVGKREVVIEQPLNLGTYYLHISSGAELTPDDGWSTYGVFGYYEIYGSVENVVREANDIIAVKLEGLDMVCSSTEIMTPVVSIQNGGVETIQSLKFEVFEDNQLVHTETKSVNLLTDETQDFTMPDITTEGSHTYKVVVSDPNGVETKTKNNSVTGSFDYTKGVMYEFYTDMPFYTGHSWLTWHVTNTTGSISSPNSGSVSKSTSGNIISQDFCLSIDHCYQLNFSGNIHECIGVNSYSPGTIYTAGDQCISPGGELYKAKWWTKGVQPPSSSWERVGTCPSGNYEFGVKDATTAAVLINVQTTTYSSPQVEEICVSGVITGVSKEAEEDYFVNVFPNPVGSVLHVVSDLSGIVKVFDVQGLLIYQSELQKEQNISTLNWPKGVYLVVFTNDKKTVSKKVIK